MEEYQNPFKTPEKEFTKSSGLGRRKVFWCSLLISLVLHLLWFLQVQLVSDWHQRHADKQAPAQSEPVRITVVEPEMETSPLDSTPQRILEVHQEETEAPEAASHLGHQNHATDRETRLPDSQQRSRGQDPGQAGDDPSPAVVAEEPPPEELQESLSLESESSPITSPTGSVRLPQEQELSEYAALMPRREELMRQFQAGYQDYIDDSVEVGDRIDINTSEYRFVGYFTLMRRAIEMVWSYPMEAARRGIQGQVHLEFTILKDGSTDRIRVLQSSGYRILDDAIVNAIRSASPFAPLPETIDQDKLTITGTFHYTLSRSFAGAH